MVRSRHISVRLPMDHPVFSLERGRRSVFVRHAIDVYWNFTQGGATTPVSPPAQVPVKSAAPVSMETDDVLARSLGDFLKL